MKAAIYGAGSLGTVLGAYIAKAGYQIDLINRNAAHVAALKESGAHIVGKVEMTVPVRAPLSYSAATCAALRLMRSIWYPALAI